MPPTVAPTIRTPSLPTTLTRSPVRSETGDTGLARRGTAQIVEPSGSTNAIEFGSTVMI